MSEKKPVEKKPRKTRAKAQPKPVVEAVHVVPTPPVVVVTPAIIPDAIVKAVAPALNPNAIGNLMDAPVEQHIHVAAYSTTNPRFFIRCQKCRWAEVNNGTTAALAHLHEITNNCATCGKARQFRCPKCGRPSKMTRVKGA